MFGNFKMIQNSIASVVLIYLLIIQISSIQNIHEPNINDQIGVHVFSSVVFKGIIPHIVYHS